MNNYEKWIHVLRWEDYQQGKGQLRTEDNKFCCLGVAVDLYAKSKDMKWTGTAWEKWEIVKESRKDFIDKDGNHWEIKDKGKWKIFREDEKDFIDENGNSWEIKVMEILGSEDSMPLKVGEWLEINKENIDIGHMEFKTHLNKNSSQYNWDGREGCYNRLTAINDSGIFSFPSIAFILETHQDITVRPPEKKITQTKEIKIKDFTVVDVETANCDQTSVCQIGIVHVNDEVITDEWKSYVNPLQKFDNFNIGIHGITEEMVADSPTIDDIQKELQQQLNGKIVITHGAFDRNALRHTLPTYNWVDSTRIIRHAYPRKYGRRGYGLKNLAYDFGITLKHHDALEDAKATADILLRVLSDTETSIDYWVDRIKKPITPSKTTSKNRGHPAYRPKLQGVDDGPLSGHTVAFTGRLVMARKEAAEVAASVGCNVDDNVTKKTTMLVIGTQTSRMIAPGDKSTKHKQAERYIGKGQEIEILTEENFLQLIEMGETSLGYDDEGFDKDGFDKYAYRKEDYDEGGYNEEGYDVEGYDRDGFDEWGYDREGYDKDGYNEDGYDKEGYDEDGYDEEGYDKDGCDEQGEDRDGNKQKDIKPVEIKWPSESELEKIKQAGERLRNEELKLRKAAQERLKARQKRREEYINKLNKNTIKNRC